MPLRTVAIDPSQPEPGVGGGGGPTGELPGWVWQLPQCGGAGAEEGRGQVEEGWDVEGMGC